MPRCYMVKKALCNKYINSVGKGLEGWGARCRSPTPPPAQPPPPAESQQQQQTKLPAPKPRYASPVTPGDYCTATFHSIFCYSLSRACYPRRPAVFSAEPGGIDAESFRGARARWLRRTRAWRAGHSLGSRLRARSSSFFPFDGFTHCESWLFQLF